jgi:2Fe-2S iron-sulfur cluster binding domain
MGNTASGPAPVEERPEASANGLLDVVNYGKSAEEGHVTRRRALKGGAAALVGAAVTAVSAGGASEAFAASKKKAKLTINVNGKNHNVQLSPDTMLLYVLRDEMHLRGPKFGCGLSQCGACAVLVDGSRSARA